MGGQTKKQLVRDILMLSMAVFMIFGLFSIKSYAQQTGAPGQDTNSSNVPDLIRINDTDGKQVKEGSFRVGSAATIDIASAFEVFGDIHGQGDLLIAALGTCQYVDGNGDPLLEPACGFDTIGESYPAFVADVNKDYVGIGTNGIVGSNNLNSKLAVYSQLNDEYLNGAVYATSTAGNGVTGITEDTTNKKAGIFGLAVNPNSVAVYGKSVDKYSRGVAGFSNETGAPAGLFWGNVVVTGGYIQGNASGLYRVSSINDSSLTVSQGGRGLGVWGNKVPITVEANNPPTENTKTTTVDLSLEPGQRIRSFTVFIRAQGAADYTLLNSSIPVTATMTPSALTFINSSNTVYEAKVFAHIENTLSITVEHPTTDGVFSVNNTQPVIFTGGGLYELKANVGAGQSTTFDWKFDTLKPKGQICQKQSDGVAVNCVPPNSGSITTTDGSIYYKFPASYSGDATWQDPIKITWGGSSDVTRTINLKVIDIQTPATPIVAEYDAGSNDAEGNLVPRVHIPVTYKTPSGVGTVSELTFALVIPEGESTRSVEDVDSSGDYRAPDIVLDNATALGARSITAPISISPVGNPETEKLVTLYLVPHLDIQTTYATDTDGQLAGTESNTVATGLDLNVNSNLFGYNEPPTNDTLVCDGCLGGQDVPGIFRSTVLGKHTITLTWTPPSGDYPASVQLVKSKDIYVSTLVVSNTSGGRNTNISVPVKVDFGEDLKDAVIALASTAYQLNSTVPVSDNLYYSTDQAVSTNPTLKGGSSRVKAISYPSDTSNVTDVTFYSDSCNSGSPFTLYARNPSDLREEKSIDVTVTGCTSTSCYNCSSCPNGPKCDPCCNTSGKQY